MAPWVLCHYCDYWVLQQAPRPPVPSEMKCYWCRDFMERGGVARSHEHYWSRFQVIKAKRNDHDSISRALKKNKLMPSKFQQSDGVMEMLANEVANFLAVQLVDQITSPDIWICCDCWGLLCKTHDWKRACTHSQSLCEISSALSLLHFSFRLA